MIRDGHTTQIKSTYYQTFSFHHPSLSLLSACSPSALLPFALLALDFSCFPRFLSRFPRFRVHYHSQLHQQTSDPRRLDFLAGSRTTPSSSLLMPRLLSALDPCCMLLDIDVPSPPPNSHPLPLQMPRRCCLGIITGWENPHGICQLRLATTREKLIPVARRVLACFTMPLLLPPLPPWLPDVFNKCCCRHHRCSMCNLSRLSPLVCVQSKSSHSRNCASRYHVLGTRFISSHYKRNFIHAHMDSHIN